MSLLNTVFSQLKAKNQTAFIPFITAGDGGLGTTISLMQTLVNSGADVLELGVPFSDPMADGKIISASHQRAVARGVSLSAVLSLVAKFRQQNSKTPIVLMGYANPIEQIGYEKFAISAKKAGVDGVLVVDMPLEESVLLKTTLQQKGIDLIFLISPTTTEARLALLADQVSGFAYFVSLKGVTGAKNFQLSTVKQQLKLVRKYINIPIGVGFGIGDATTAKHLSKIADAVIVGSALVKLIAKHQAHKKLLLKVIADAVINIKAEMV